MKIIDWERKGNVVRFYLGDDDCKDYRGDDWNDAPYEHNAGRVYDEFIKGHADINIPFDYEVYEPADGCANSPYCKNDMRERKVPCIVVAKTEDVGSDWNYGFNKAVANPNTRKYYFGDKI
jgi:hypothetical protein